MEIIKSYKNVNKYDNWDFVVKSIIKRRVFDYKKKLINNIVSFESNIPLAQETSSIYDINNEFLQIPCFRKGCETRDLFDLVYDHVMENNNNYFEEHEIEFMEIIGELYEYGNSMEPDEIVECYGIVVKPDHKDYNKEEHKTYLKSVKVFYKKILTTLKEKYNEDSLS